MRPIGLAIFIDANVPPLFGRSPSSLREPRTAILGTVAQSANEFITDAEVLQELLHVYISRRLWPEGREVFRTFLGVMAGRVESTMVTDPLDAAVLADVYSP
jgi:predicted nucleic acid-binding protein